MGPLKEFNSALRRRVHGAMNFNLNAAGARS